MNRILLTIILLLPLTVQAQQDQSILFEVGFGFGTSTSTTSNACSNRSSDRPIFAAVRYRYDDVEVHGATWNGADCGRDAIAVGVGYVIDTQSDGLAGRDDAYASWTPGVSYVWQGDSTTSRLENNVNMFNRVAVGVSDDDIMVELAVNRYGRILKNYDTTGENFVTVGLGYQDLVDNLPTAPTDTLVSTKTDPSTVPPSVTTDAKGGDTGGDTGGDNPPVVDDPYTSHNKNDDKDGVPDGNAGGGDNTNGNNGGDNTNTNGNNGGGDTAGDVLGKIGKGNASDTGNAEAGDHPSDKAR